MLENDLPELLPACNISQCEFILRVVFFILFYLENKLFINLKNVKNEKVFAKFK